MKHVRLTFVPVLLGLLSLTVIWLNQTEPVPSSELLRDEIALKDGKSPYDQPAEAAAFFHNKRMPAESKTTYSERLAQAEKESQALPLFSSLLDREMSRDEAVRGAGTASWSNLGPGNIGGRTRRLSIHPTSPDIMVAGAVSGGIFRTTDGGANWTATGDGMANLAVCSLARDPNDADRLLAGTGEGFFNSDSVRGAGIFRSSDGGLTWTYMANTATSHFYYVNDIIYSSTVADTVYAATRTGVHRSTDAGENWTRIYTAGVAGGALDLAIRTDQATDVLFASVGTFTTATIYRNDDAANTTTFNSVYTESDMGRTTIAIAPSNQDVVYLLASNLSGLGISGFNYGLLAVIRSTDGGDNWSDRHRVSDPLAGADLLLSNPFAQVCSSFLSNQGWYDNIIKVDPVDEDIVWAGGIDLFRSNDGGANWGVASHWAVNDAASMYVHADQHNIIFHPDYDGSTNQTMYVTNDGGVFRTNNARAAVADIDNDSLCNVNGTYNVVWTSLNNSYGATQFYHGLPFPATDSYFGGTQDNGTLLGTDGTGVNGWEEINGGDGGYVAINPTNTDIMYVETTGISIRKSTNGGSSFSSAVSGISDTGLFINPFVMDPNDPDRLWTSGFALWRTDDAAANWTQASTAVNSSTREQVSAIAVAPGNSDLVLAGTEDGYIRRTTSATTDTSASSWSESQLQDAYISCVAFDPQDADIVYCTFSTFGVNHVYRSSDGGASWSNIDNNLPDLPVHAIAVHPSDSTRLYLGTDLGVYVSTDTGANWAQENTGYANVVTEWLTFQETDCVLTLYAFTHGRGAWRLPLDFLSISPTSDQAVAAGESASVSVTAPSACAWTAVSQDAWITVTAGASGTGNGTVSYTVAENSAPSSRSGSILIGGETFTVNQDAGACTYVLSPTNISYDDQGGSDAFSVTPSDGTCAWTAVASDAWITITAGSSGTGSGTVSFTVAANATIDARSGTITVADQTFTINQSGVVCAYTLNPTSNSFDDQGGSATFGVTTNVQTCTWTASAQDGWISITAGASGTGDGTVSYSVAANTATDSRTGTITVQGQTFTITQSGVPCTYSLNPTSDSFDEQGGSGSFAVTTNVQTCAWTASSQDNWISVTAGASGSGDGTVSFSVDANATIDSRSGTITVEDQTFTISQSGVPCTYSLNPTSNSFDDQGGSGSFAVTTNVQTCTWTASSQDDWISVTAGASGTGDGTISYSVDANATTDSRSGTITVQDQTYTITQSGAVCSYSLNPTSNSFDDQGGSGSFAVTTNVQTCAWTASTQDDWVAVTAGASGTGDGTVSYSVDANPTTDSRSATITVADQTFTITQAGLGCTFSLNPTSNTFDDQGGSGSFAITTNVQTCAWTASAQDDWIAVTAGASGTGDGTVSYSVDANNTLASRTGTISVGNQTFTITQSGVVCDYILSPESLSVDANGGSDSFSIQTNNAECTWAATTQDDWLTITAGASGTGTGSVSFTVAANGETSARVGTITAGGQTFTVNQAALVCTYSLSPTSLAFDAAGGSDAFAVQTNGATCTWSATTQDDWITITAGSSGTGNGTVSFTVAANSAVATRTGSIQVADQTFTVSQAAAACSYSLNPLSASYDDQGGNGSFSVTTNDASCAWTASTQDDWITITAGQSGSGSGTVTYVVAQNATNQARTGTIQVSDQTFTIQQSGIVPCDYSLAPTQISFTAAGGNGGFEVITNLPTCGWTAVTQDDWITITTGQSGTGSGSVLFTVAEHAATTARTGTISVQDQTFTIDQSGRVACDLSLSATSATFFDNGGNGGFEISTSAPTCSWTATTQDDWITITAGQAGVGDGGVSFVVAQSDGGSRTGTITITNLDVTLTFTVVQVPCTARAELLAALPGWNTEVDILGLIQFAGCAPPPPPVAAKAAPAPIEPIAGER